MFLEKSETELALLVQGYENKKYTDVAEMSGLTIAAIYGMNVNSEYVIFVTECDRLFGLIHEQSCCETVYLNDIVGDVEDLIGGRLNLSRETESINEIPNDCESQTWTFYSFATSKGYVDLRWIGESNGYYSETVEFVEITSDKE